MKVFQDVVEALKDDKLNIIRVYGMGGMGQSTLVKQVAKQVRKISFSMWLLRYQIQDKFAFYIGMKFDLDDSIYERTARLCARLKKEKRILIIMDNIWRKLEFDKIGIPSGDVDEKDRKDDDQRQCKIILTSRSRDLLLCSDMKS
ncbi:hypothetical protein WN943_007007 [Citrus x changshan-huyou]